MSKRVIILQYVILMLCLMCSILHSQNRWQSINPQPTGSDLYKIDKDMFGNIWAFGAYGTMIKSTDDGKSWSQIPVNEYNSFYDAAIIGNKIWVVGSEGKIVYSGDNGISWTRQNVNTKKALDKIQFIDEKNGWILGRDSIILRTEDGGLNWQIIKTSSRWPQNDITFVNSKEGYILSGYYSAGIDWIPASSSGEIIKTTDGGKSWKTIITGSSQFYSLSFVNENIGFISAQDSKRGNFILKTSNGAKTWDTIKTSKTWSKLFYKDSLNGIALGIPYVGKTTDGGKSWQTFNLINTPSSISRFISLYSRNDELIIAGTEGNILNSTDYGNTWNFISKSLPIYYGFLLGVTFSDELYGFIYGQQWSGASSHNPLLIKTVDGGKNWTKEKSPDSDGFSIMKKNGNVLWAASYKYLYKSIDRGISWKQVFVDTFTTDLIRDFACWDENNIALIKGKIVYYTTDGGKNWNTYTKFNAMFMKQVFMLSVNRWIIIGHTGNTEPCYFTNDAGKSWNLMENKFTAMDFINNKVGYASDSVLYKTTDSGLNWSLVTSSMKSKTYWTSSLHFLTEEIGWMLSSNIVYFTNDGGKSWKQEYGIQGYTNVPDISAMCIVDKDNIWAVCGDIFKIIPGTITNINEKQLAIIPQTITLYQNYPNPFNPSTTIRYQIPVVDALSAAEVPVTLKVYDMLGREVATLVNEEKGPGIYNVKFDVSHSERSRGIASGIYFYRMQCGSFSETKKLVIMK